MSLGWGAPGRLSLVWGDGCPRLLPQGISLPRLLSPEDPCSSPAPCPRASSIHPQNPLQVRAGGWENCLRGGALAGSVLSVRVSSPGKASSPLPHPLSYPYTIALVPRTPPRPPPPRSLRLFPLSSACFLQGLTMNQMKKLLGRKASLPRYLAAYPAPGGHPGGGASGALSQVGRGFPAEGRP